jgi:hypothetical protein
MKCYVRIDTCRWAFIGVATRPFSGRLGAGSRQPAIGLGAVDASCPAGGRPAGSGAAPVERARLDQPLIVVSLAGGGECDSARVEELPDRAVLHDRARRPGGEIIGSRERPATFVVSVAVGTSAGVPAQVVLPMKSTMTT